MDPNLDPAHSEDELTRVSNANSEQSIRKTTTSGEGQVSQSVATTTTTPTSKSTKSEQTVGATAGATSVYNQKKTLFHSYQAIWYIFGFIEIVLAFRFVLKILGANPEADFSKFIYGLSMPFAAPFTSIFQSTASKGVETTSFVEWSTLIAAFVYVVLTWGIIKIFNLGKPVTPTEVNDAVSSQ